MLRSTIAAALLAALTANVAAAAAPPSQAFLKTHCFECHNKETKEGNLDLAGLDYNLANVDNFALWVKVHDRLEAGEMPPKDSERPPADQAASVVKSLDSALKAAERARLGANERTGLRRLTRVEYENTVRDLFDMPGAAV